MSNHILISQLICSFEKEVEDFKNTTFKIGDFDNSFAIKGSEEIKTIYSKIDSRNKLIKSLKEVLEGK